MPYSIPYNKVTTEVAIRRITNALNDLDSRVDNGGGGGAVSSVNGQTGAVVLVKGDIGLGNANNTSDANKPISTAVQTALDGKQDAGSNNSYFPAGF
jgi:hypothetical protein